jgi:hypothetical protein
MKCDTPQEINQNVEDKQGNEDDKLLEGLASLPYLERLTCFIRGSTRHSVTGGVTVVDFRPLYSVTIHHLQRQLAEEIQKLTNADLTTPQLDRIRETLHKYSTAISATPQRLGTCTLTIMQLTLCGISSSSTRTDGTHTL